MSNNYHTQTNQNVLNDIAAAQHLNNPDQFMSQSQQEQLKLQLQQEQLKLQLQQEQMKLYQQQEQLKMQHKMMEEQMRAKKDTVANQPPKAAPIIETFQSGQNQQKSGPNREMDEIELSDPAPENKMSPRPPSKRNVPQPIINQSTQWLSEKTIADYVIIPGFLVIIFVLLVYPGTAGYIEKYLPVMNDWKGYLSRGLLLAVLYIVIRFGVTQFYLKE